MAFQRLWGSLQVLLMVLAVMTSGAAAAFTNGFEGVKAGSELRLVWEAVEERYYPLCVTAQMIQKGSDGVSATVYKANVTSAVNGTSYVWKGVPFPLNHVADGMYQLEIHPAAMTGSHPQLLAKSPFFEVGKMESGNTDSKSDKPSTPGNNQSGNAASNVNKPLAIGLGVAIGVPSVVALVLVGWCFRRRRRRTVMEKRRRTRRDFVID
ncbi:hypothetical protein B0T16DRAFT_429868 [Cercophora newfieldiana]|uniref:Uncharacterized protein n=1 Tax=Cercophora newfieldiana TaxID=92897 RepID=A0AA39XZS5_9PEZI|nr:hypothetical protein B0T16DRAFT_429868 [Cercophora newfieldiana]